MRLFLLPTFAVILITIASTASDARHHSNPNDTGLPHVSYASAAPDFSFVSAGTTTRLSASEGKPVVLNFWATWCEPCAAELDAFARLSKTYGDAVVLIAISDQAASITEPVLAAHGVAARAVADPARKIFGLYGLNTVTAIPITLVLGRDGKVAHVSIGELDWAELQAAVDRVSAPLPLPSPS